MHNVKEKGFTLIELIAVLVIMAILALIVTPLVMSIIRKARISADKRSIDAYGRSIELAIAGYLLDTGKFPSEVSQLTIEYSGNKVECTTTQINPDSSVYLSDCKVNNREVSNYSYGSDKSPTYQTYKVGDTVTYNDIDFYVIKDSGAKEDAVTLLKAEPLTTEEVNLYGGVGTNNNHVNNYTLELQGRAYDLNGYGGMAYYTSETCGFINNNHLEEGCKTDYASSEIKYVVDAWKKYQVSKAIEARLITKEEYQKMCKEEEYQSTPSDISTRFVPQYDWLRINYRCWTNTTFNDSTDSVWGIDEYVNSFSNISVYAVNVIVRPVIILPKSALN